MHSVFGSNCSFIRRHTSKKYKFLEESHKLGIIVQSVIRVQCTAISAGFTRAHNERKKQTEKAAEVHFVVEKSTTAIRAHAAIAINENTASEKKVHSFRTQLCTHGSIAKLTSGGLQIPP